MKFKKALATVTSIVMIAGSMGIIANAESYYSTSNSDTNISTILGSGQISLSDTPMGFGSSVTGGGDLSETNSNYAKVSTAAELGKALKKGSGIKVIEIMNDIDLGWNMIGSSAQTSPYAENNTPLTHPSLIKSGVSKLKVDSFDGLTIYSKNGAKLTHCGFTFKNCSNIEIRNIQFDEFWEWDEYSKGNYDRNDWDFITLEGCDGVWIDHCTFGKAYDGVVDSKKGTKGLTISWSKFLPADITIDFYKTQFDTMEADPSSYPMYNYLRNTVGLSKDTIMKTAAPQKKTHLIGSNELDTTNNDLQVTLCYNQYIDSQDRMPRLRGGNAHAFNNIMDASNAYNVSQLITSDQKKTIESSSYHFGITSNGAISTEGGAVLLENSVIKGIMYPLRNNQKSATNATYTGKILAKNVSYAYEDINFIGNSTDSNSPLSPVPAEIVDFSWSNGLAELPYKYTMYDVNEVESIVSNGAGVTTSSSTPDVTTTTTVTTTATTTTTQPTITTTTPITTTTTVTTSKPNIDDTIVTDAIYCSPSASDSGKGTKDDPISLINAITSVKAGGTIYLLDGTYKYSSVMTIGEDNCGESGKLKTLRAYPNANVTLDFSGESYNMTDTSKNDRGLQLDGDYWHIYGIKITGAADNGMYVTGNNNIVEFCEFDGNRDTGLQISRKSSSLSDIKDWPSNNLILNCTSCNNMDPATGENADGFAAKLTCGEGNVFDGCISYNNVDDGWDLYAKTETGAIGVVTIRNCIAFRNGQTAEGVFTANSDGNGFKMGGGGVGTAHIVENCLSFENKKHGFTDNNNPLFSSIKNCTSYSNGMDSGANFQMDRCTSGTFLNLLSYKNNSSTSDKFNGNISDSIFYNSKKYYLVEGSLAVANSKVGVENAGPADSDFVSVESPALGADVHTLWRNTDGSINTHGFMTLKDSSVFKDMGADFSSTSEPIVTTTTTSETTTTNTTLDGSTILYGDVNCDGKVSSADLVMFSRYMVGTVTVSEQGIINADVTKDNIATVADLVKLAKYFVGQAELN